MRGDWGREEEKVLRPQIVGAGFLAQYPSPSGRAEVGGRGLRPTGPGLLGARPLLAIFDPKRRRLVFML